MRQRRRLMPVPDRAEARADPVVGPASPSAEVAELQATIGALRESCLDRAARLGELCAEATTLRERTAALRARRSSQRAAS